MKPQQILDLEKAFGIKLTLDSYSNAKNTYNVNAAGDVIMLNLQQNNIVDISCLKGLTSLQKLNLSVNSIVDITPLANLRNLSNLNMMYNKISEISNLSSLSNLTDLNLGNNQITNAAPIQYLTNLTYLNISNNLLSSTTFLSRLTNLTNLSLFSNKITTLTGFYGLSKLTSLSLWSNQIADISALANLTSITGLYLANNKIKDITPLEKLINITTLRLDGNEIERIQPLKEIKKLNDLYIAKNGISDISVLRYLGQLKKLHLAHNEIIDISVLQYLSLLTELNLYGNKVFDITPLFELLNKKQPNISIALENYSLFTKTNTFHLGNNPTTSPPYERLKKGKDEVVKWMIAHKKALHEIKVLLVGQPEAGKTSLLKRLRSGEYVKGEKQTDGILIERFYFEHLPAFENYKTILNDTIAHFWDFGGQEIMSATHQFFMTERSLYLLLLEARNDVKADEQIREWLKRIQTFGSTSDVLVLINKIDTNRGFGVDTTVLQRDFPQIKRFIHISCEQNEGIEEVKAALAEIIPQTELYNELIDKRWISIKDDLQNRTDRENFLPDRVFRDICIRNKLTDRNEQKKAIAFLNDLGILLHFEELDLQEYFVLDPRWVTSGVYEVITSPSASKAGGKVDIKNLLYIINEEAGKEGAYIPENQKRIVYSPNEVVYIANIMTQFKLAYYSKDRAYLFVPNLFPVKTPADTSNEYLNATEALQLAYEYDYLPANILARFMIEMQNDIREYWRSGVVLYQYGDNPANAMVTAEQHRIKIIVRGAAREKQEYLSVIRFHLDAINASFPGMKPPNLMILLPNSGGKDEKYQRLKNMEKQGVIEYKDFDESPEKTYNIIELLEGIDDVNKVVEIGKESQEKALKSFEKELYDLLEEKSQNAIADILIQIKNSKYDYNRSLYQEIENGMSPNSQSLQAQNLVNSTKTLINTLNIKKQ